MRNSSGVSVPYSFPRCRVRDLVRTDRTPVSKLVEMLSSMDYFVRVGLREFRLSRKLFSAPGDSPNYFTTVFCLVTAKPVMGYPDPNQTTLARPPTLSAVTVPYVSADAFAELIDLLQGNDIHIRDHEHRESLRRSCRRLYIRGLEQRLTPHRISHNLVLGRSEMLLRLEDVHPSGIQFVANTFDPDACRECLTGWFLYKRRFDEKAEHELVFEVSEEAFQIDTETEQATVHLETRARLLELYRFVETNVNHALEHMRPSKGCLLRDKVKLNNTILEGNYVTMRIDENTELNLNSRFPESTPSSPQAMSENVLGGATARMWYVTKGQWKLVAKISRVSPTEEQIDVELVTLKLEAYTTQRGRNASRQYLT